MKRNLKGVVKHVFRGRGGMDTSRVTKGDVLRAANLTFVKYSKTFKDLALYDRREKTAR